MISNNIENFLKVDHDFLRFYYNAEMGGKPFNAFFFFLKKNQHTSKHVEIGYQT
jgi:hypothetical protein